MNTDIIIGVAGLVLSVLSYFAGVKRTQKQIARQERAQEFKRVLDRYMDFRKTNRTSGLDGLQRAGVAILASDSEIRKLIGMIQQHGEKNPLGQTPELFSDIDLKEFFEFTTSDGVNLYTRAETIVEQFRMAKTGAAISDGS